MRRVALRGVAARRLRALTTTLAVFLGVALVSGTYVLTDTINASFDDIFAESLRGTDVVITTREVVAQENAEPPAFPARVLGRVRRVDGVDAAAGSIFSLGRFFDTRGKQLGAGFAPNFIASTLPRRFETLSVVSGRRPRTAGETALDQQTAKRAGVGIGERIEIVGERRARSYRVVGITRLGETSFGGAAIAQLTLPEAQRMTNKRGRFDQVSVAAKNGVSADQLRDRLQGVLPQSLLVETAKQSADRQGKQIAQDLSFIKIVLLVFAGVALFVGAFLIFNTFSITVAQRIREFGLLRTLGASRGQVLGSVLLEAGVTGALGSLAGLAGGLAFAPAINALFESFGVNLPNTGTVVATRTIAVSLLLGLAVTLVSALAPALRATRVTPMAALREAELPESRRRGRLWATLALALCALGVALTCIGLFGGIRDSGSAAGLMGGGAFCVLLGVSIWSPRLVRPLAAVIGAPIERLRGLTGRLARENAIRKPGRTAVTAAALMIGLALVVFVTVFAAGVTASVDRTIERDLQGDLTIQNIDGFSPIPSGVASAARRVPGVALVSSLRFSQARVRGVGGNDSVSAVDPRTVNSVLKLDWKHGGPATLRRLGDRGAVIDQAWGRSHGIGVGDRISLLTPADRHVTFTVRGAVKDDVNLLGSLLISQRTLAREFRERRDTMTFVKLRPGASPEAVQASLTRLVERDFPSAEVLNQKGLKDRAHEQLNQVLALFYALLSLAVAVSLFGIVNTLALSIHERTRELGMLRAVGMSRRQVRRMIRYEAVITALIGAVLGTVLGVVFAALVSRPLADEGFTLSFPVATLLVLLILAGLAGVVAAIAPARRAARLDVLEALAYE